MPEAPITADRYITEVTHRRLLDGLDWLRGTVPSGYREFLTPAHTFWSGALPETDFLARLYDLNELPSTDPRYTTAFQDICQHRVMNEDWDDDWIFRDSRFGLANSDEALLLFLAEMLHPAVRTNPAEVERLHNFLNGVLAHDGYSWSRSTTSAVRRFRPAPDRHRRPRHHEESDLRRDRSQARDRARRRRQQRPAHHRQRAGLPDVRPAAGRARADLGRADRLVGRPGRHGRRPRKGGLL